MAATALAPFMDARTEQSVCASASLGVEAARALSALLDQGIAELAQGVARPGLAFIALGSYGRSELCRNSDIDVMLLANGNPGDAVNAVLYPLWDTAVKVGHSVRSIDQALEAAHANVETLTSLLDARLITGDAALFARFIEARRGLLRRDRAAMTAELRERHGKLVAAEPWQLQELDLKNGRGGLRDAQWARWVVTAEAFANGEEPPAVPAPLAAAYDAVLATRFALHAFSSRALDRFNGELAGPTAELLGLPRIQAVRRVVEAGRLIDAESQRVFGAVEEAPERRSWLASLFRRSAPTVTRVHRAARAEESAAEPTSDLDALRTALRTAEPGALDPLPRAPWLERLLPEWEVLRGLPHIAPFHLHPVDVHSWRAVVEARRAIAEDADESGTPAVAAALNDHDELLLCSMLHDIGKGREGDHSHVGAVIAERFAARVGLSPEESSRLATVVKLHLLLPTVATRRDIADPRVIRETAEQIGDARTLRLLYLLGVADARASGPDVWSAWKAQLMRSLYLRTLEHLEAEGEPEAATDRRRNDVFEALAGRFPREAIERHLRVLTPSYLLSMTPEVIGDHIALIERAAGRTAVGHDRIGDVDRVTVVTPDRPGILSLVAGTLAVHNVSVLGGSAFTRDDGVAIQVMYVADGLGHGIDERRWERVFEAVPAVLEGEFPLEERLEETRRSYGASVPIVQIPTTVQVDNVGSDAYSIVEVTAADRIGLLYAITHAMHSLALDIHVAKVDTIGREVVDAFYVRRQNGRRVEAPDEIERLKRRVAEAVAALDSPAH